MQVRGAFKQWTHAAIYLEGMAAAGAPGGAAAALRAARAEKIKLLQQADEKENELRQASLALAISRGGAPSGVSVVELESGGFAAAESAAAEGMMRRLRDLESEIAISNEALRR